MALPSLLDAFTVVVLIVPGFFSFTIARAVLPTKRKKFTEFEMVVYSFTFTLAVFSTFSLVTGINNVDAIRDSILNPWNLMWLLGLSLFWGLCPAYLVRSLTRGEYVIDESWDLFQDKLGESAYVTVFTEDGQEYKGWVHYMGESEGKAELILGDPKQILRDKDWSVLSEMEIGRELLFTNKDIRRIASFKPLE